MSLLWVRSRGVLHVAPRDFKAGASALICISRRAPFEGNDEATLGRVWSTVVCGLCLLWGSTCILYISTTKQEENENEILSAPSTLCLQYSTGPVVVRLAEMAN